MYSLLLISHSSEMTGGGEDDFERIARYCSDKYILYGIMPQGVRVKWLSGYFKEVLITESNIFPFSRLSKPRHYLDYFLKSRRINQSINKFLKDKSIDCAFVNSSVMFPVLSVLHKNRIPSIMSIKEVIKPDFIRSIIYAYINRKSSKVIFISKYIESMSKQYIERKKTAVIYCAIEDIPIEDVSISSKDTSPSEFDFKIVNVGVIAHNKGQDVLLDALSKMEDVRIKVTFIGRVIDKKYFIYLLKKSSNLKENISIEFLYELPKKEVYRELLNASVVVVTSLEEGFSLVILEALLLKKLVVSSKVGIAREIIVNNVNGFLYNAGESKELLNILKFLKNNRDLFTELPNNASMNMEDKFNLLGNLNKIDSVIINAISERR